MTFFKRSKVKLSRGLPGLHANSERSKGTLRDVPDFIHVYPGGSFVEGNDGRTFRMDDVELVLNGTQFPLRIDLEHESVFGGSTKSYGWIDRIEYQETAEGTHRAPGFWGHVEWTPQGHEIVEEGEYRFLSPVLWVAWNSEEEWAAGEAPRVVGFESIGLTGRPNLGDLTSINSEDGAAAPVPAPGPKETKMHADLSALAPMLGLTAEANEAEFAKAVRTNMVLRTELEHSQSLLTEANARADKAEQRLEEQAKSQHEANATAALDQAEADGKMIPATRQAYANMCKTPEGLELFRDIMANTKPAVTTETKANSTEEPTVEPTIALNAQEKHAAKKLGLTDEEYANAKKGEA